MGTDGNVRDEFSRIIYGARISLTLGFFTVTIALLVGGFFGAIAGYVGGWFDNIVMRIMDVILGFPSLLLAIAIVAVLGPGLQNALIAIAIVAIPAYARAMRQVLAIKESDFVQASVALGSSSRQLLLRRVIPNALTPLVVLATLGLRPLSSKQQDSHSSASERSHQTPSGDRCSPRNETTFSRRLFLSFSGLCNHADRARLQPHG